MLGSGEVDSDFSFGVPGFDFDDNYLAVDFEVGVVAKFSS